MLSYYVLGHESHNRIEVIYAKNVKRTEDGDGYRIHGNTHDGDFEDAS